jgi:hypothetical protein
MAGEKIFILHGKHETVRRTVFTEDSKVTGLIDLITIENGEAVRHLLVQLWRNYDTAESLLNEILKHNYIAPPELFTVEKSSLEELNKEPGKFYPRIYRPFYHDQFGLTNLREFNVAVKLQGELKFPECIPFNRNAILLSINQLALFKTMLVEIFNNVFPSFDNLLAYGHTIKNLLVLSCIEIEAHLQAIMIANNIRPAGRFYTTVDYVKLKDVLQLDKYSVSFNFYKDINDITPFNNWNSLSPTASIPWYESYNKIKHDGDAAFNHASLQNVISAISAIVILMYAQFGKNIPYWKEEIGLFFDVKNTCSWTIDDFLLPPFKGDEWIPHDFQL